MLVGGTTAVHKRASRDGVTQLRLAHPCWANQLRHRAKREPPTQVRVERRQAGAQRLRLASQEMQCSSRRRRHRSRNGADQLAHVWEVQVERLD